MIDTNKVAQIFRELENDYGYTTEQLAPLSLIEFNINEEDLELCVTKLLMDPDFHHTPNEIKKITYEDDSIGRWLTANGFDGAYKVWFKNGETTYYAWHYGDEELTEIQYVPLKGDANREIAERIQNILETCQYDGEDPVLSYDVRNKFIDVDVDGDCIVINYTSQESYPEQVKGEIIDLLRDKLPEFGKVEIWLYVKNRQGDEGTYQII